jgi:hypothetical protein
MQWQVTTCSDLSLDVVTRFAAYIALGAKAAEEKTQPSFSLGNLPWM